MAISRFKKISFIAAGCVLIFIIVVIACVSPIAKYLLEKYDTKILGREVTVEGAYVNPFTGYVRFSGIKIFENHSDSVFIAAKSLSGNFSILKLLVKTYEIDHLHLDEPKVYIIQNKENLNFKDIIEFYSPKKPRTKKKKPVHLNLLNMEVIKGEFYYFEQSIPVKYSVKKFNVSTPGLRWNVDSMNVKFDFISGNGIGDIKGNIVLGLDSSYYRLAAKINKFDLQFLEQYLKDLSNFGKFGANADADFRASGNFKDAQNINTSGLFSLNDFHVGKTASDDYVSFKKFTVNIEQLNPRNKKYAFDSISLIHPYCKYELYDYLNNIEMMFGKGGKKAVNHSEFNIIVEIGKYIEQLAKNFLKSNYKINRLAIYDGDLRYHDYTLGEKFSISANPVYFIADSIKREDKPVDFSFKTGIKPYGNATVFISINPKDSSDFDVNYNFDQIPLTIFNPYLIKYTSFPLDRGTLELKGKWRVRNGNISANNRLTIIDPRIYNRVRNKNNRRLPMHLITYIVRERGNVIDYDIPITGNLKDPNFHFKDVIFDVLGNIFVKPVKTPYIVKVRSLENEIEQSRVLRWEMRQSSLSSDQDKFMSELSEFLLENPKVVLNIKQSVYSEKEKEYLVLYEAKKRYYLNKYKMQATHLTAEDESDIESMSIKDSLFIHFLNRNTNHKLLFTIQDKCYVLIGHKEVDKKFKQLIKDRETAFMNYFKDKEFSGRIKIMPMEDKIPYNGFSSYRIDYKGNLPKDVKEALSEMNDLNSKDPRKKYKKDRDTRRSLIGAGNKKSKNK